MQGGRGADWSGIPGGKFSLGRLKAGSGYCVGAVVETRMGMNGENGGGTAGGENGWMGKSRGTLAGNGMRDVWVIGEGFFRGVGAVFDVGKTFVLSRGHADTAIDDSFKSRESASAHTDS